MKPIGILFLCLAAAACTRYGDQAERYEGDIATPEVVSFPVPEDTTPEILDEYRVTFGDLLTVNDLSHPGSLRDNILVDSDGCITYQMLTGIPAAGKSLNEIATLVQERLAKFHREPLITVALSTNGARGHRLYVLGQVRNPGAITYDRPLRVLDAIGIAGGFLNQEREGRAQQSVDLPHSSLIRNGEAIPIDFAALVEQGDLRYNIHLHPGDLVMISSLLDKEVYVLGAVNQPGEQPFVRDLGVVGALARAGGIAERGHRSHICVLRGNMAKPEVHLVDMDQVLSGRMRDFALAGGDVIFVSDRPFQYLRELATAGINAFFSALGSRAAGETASSLGF